MSIVRVLAKSPCEIYLKNTQIKPCKANHDSTCFEAMDFFLSQVPWCKKHKFLHFACNHSKQAWVRKVNRGRLGVLKVHTGKIDKCWHMAKKSLPPNLLTKSGQNKDVMLWLRCWQWRYENASQDLFKRTGKMLK